MHLFNVATLFVVLTLLGVEFSVSAFVNPTVWRLEPESQLKALSRFAVVGGKVMPVWYLISTLLLGIPDLALLAYTGALNPAYSGFDHGSYCGGIAIFVLVPLNSRVAKGAADWQRIHRIWDRIHRVRIAALAIAAFLLTYVVVQ